MATGVNDYQLLPIFLISLVVLLSATEFGRWLGTRLSDQGADEVDPARRGPWSIGTDDRLYLRHGFVAL